jgi:ribosomal protein L17
MVNVSAAESLSTTRILALPEAKEERCMNELTSLISVAQNSSLPLFRVCLSWLIQQSKALQKLFANTAADFWNKQ